MPNAVFFDFELVTLNGQQLYLSALEGRDTIDRGVSGVLRLVCHPDALTVDEHRVNLEAVAYMRTIRREVEPQATIEDAGRLRVVGGADAS